MPWKEKFVAIFVRLAYHELHTDSRPALFLAFFVGRFFFPLLSFRIRFVFAIFSTTVFGSPNLP